MTDSPAAAATYCADAERLGVVRGCPHGAGITYRPARGVRGPRMLNAVLAVAHRDGHLAHHRGLNAPQVGVLDVYDAAGNVVIDDYRIPTPEAWAVMSSVLELEAASSGCPYCDPDAYRGGRRVPGRRP